MGLLFEQCEFLIRALNRGLLDDSIPEFVRERAGGGNAVSEEMCRNLGDSPALENFIQRMERIVNNCRNIVPEYNNTFEQKRELIQSMNIVERRNDTICD
jgi:hypothetical protein